MTTAKAAPAGAAKVKRDVPENFTAIEATDQATIDENLYAGRTVLLYDGFIAVSNN